MISIPSSDASPRVFRGNFLWLHCDYYDLPWIDMLTEQMKNRLVIVDLQLDNWFEIALQKADVLSKQKFKASESEKQIFDTETQMKKLTRNL